MKLKNISGADLTCPLLVPEHVEAGAVVEVPDDLDVTWPADYWQPVDDKPARAKKNEGE